MNTAFANMMFGWVLCGLQAKLHLAFLIGYFLMRNAPASELHGYVQKGTKATTAGTIFLMTVGWAIFFFWSQVLWTDFSSGPCTEGWQAFDLINWIIILMVTCWPAFVISFVCCLGLCCAPCIY